MLMPLFYALTYERRMPLMQSLEFEVVHLICGGIDVHKKSLVAAVCVTDPTALEARYSVKVFNSTNSDIVALRDWLLAQGCHDVCMESTGKYWIPVFNILEPHLNVCLTHPKYVKAIKGKKTDKRDAKWIANLFRFDIVKASFIPPADIRALRELSRYRLKLSYMRSAEKNRYQNSMTISRIRLAKRRGRKKAVIAIARMMLTCIYHMLTEEKDFCPNDYEAVIQPPKQKAVVLNLDNTLQFLREQGADPETIKLIQQQCTVQPAGYLFLMDFSTKGIVRSKFRT